MATGDDYVEIDSIHDESGDEILIGAIGDKVALTINEGISVFLGTAERERFAHAWAEAERRAEARHE